MSLEHPIKSSAFWQINIGHVATMVVCIFTAGIVWGDLNHGVLQLRRDQDALVIRLDQMDERGTHASQKGIYQESEFSKGNERRLEELERQWREAGPKLERIDVNLTWLMKAQGIDPKKP